MSWRIVRERDRLGPSPATRRAPVVAAQRPPCLRACKRGRLPGSALGEAERGRACQGKDSPHTEAMGLAASRAGGPRGVLGGENTWSPCEGSYGSVQHKASAAQGDIAAHEASALVSTLASLSLIIDQSRITY